MLRVMLGVCGAVLIALGVFGGSLIENTYKSVQAMMQPGETIIVEAQDSVIVSAQQVSESDMAEDESENPLLIAQAAATALDKTAPALQKLEIQTTKAMTEVKASAKVLADTAVTAPGELMAVKVAAVDNQPATILPKELEVQQVVETTVGTVPDNTLYVAKDSVNLREGPSIDHPIVLELTMGQELMEFKRDGKWIHVGAYGTSGKIGWVHSMLVGKDGIVTGE